MEKTYTLDQWLRHEGRKGSWIADQLGVTDAMVSKWRRGHVLPIMPYRADIERITRGAVPVSVWV